LVEKNAIFHTHYRYHQRSGPGRHGHCYNPVAPAYLIWAYYAHGRQRRCQEDPVSLVSGRLEKTTRSSPHDVAQYRPTGSETKPPIAYTLPEAADLAQNRPLWKMIRRMAVRNRELHARNDDDDITV